MACEVVALTFASPDPERLARFWGGLLGWDVTIERGTPALTGLPEVGFNLRFVSGTGAESSHRRNTQSLLRLRVADRGGLPVLPS